MAIRLNTVWAGLLWLCTAMAGAAPGDLELDVSGNLAGPASQAASVRHFTAADLLALPVHALETSTNWTPRRKWEGPRLLDVLRKAGANGQSITVFAYDDFEQNIPLSFIRQYDPILAYSGDGRRLDVKDLGPLFIIFPRDAYPTELSTVAMSRRFVFQVRRIEVK
jgi:hypothetical protein